MQKNITRLYLLGLITIITLGVTYAYTTVSDSLTYLRGAGDTGHIGFIITQMFGTDDKIDSAYLDLPAGMTVQNATTSVTGIVMLDNATGSTLTTKAPTINILTQVWNNLNTRINNLAGSSLTTETDPVWNTASGNYYTKTQVDSNLNLKENVANKSTLTTLGTSDTLYPTQNAVKSYVDSGLASKENISNKSSTPTLGTSDTLYPTQNAVKSYVDTGLASKAPLASPSLTGTPTSITPTDGDISTKIATTAFVEARMAQAAGTTSAGKYNISCGTAGTAYYFCCRINTETGETQCKRTQNTMASWYSGSNPFPNDTSSSNNLPGFFVLTNGTWNGNLGGLAGANSKCLSDLTANNWMGKANAGTLTSANVRAWLCDPFTCQLPNASKIYTFAKSGNTSVGGANMIVNASQQGPNDNAYWSDSTYFGNTNSYWSNFGGNSTMWSTTPNASSLASTCQGWNDGTTYNYGYYGNANSNTTNRFVVSQQLCSNTLSLICIVN